MTNNSQKSFLEFLHNKFNMAVTGYSDKYNIIQVQVNKIKGKRIFLVPFEKKDIMNYIHYDKDGKMFTVKVGQYFIKNEATGEKKIINVGKSDTLATKLYQRDLIILDTTNKYNEKLFKDLAPYEVLDFPKKINLYYKVDKNTIFNDLMEAGKSNEK